MPKFNNLPQFFEELKLKEVITIEELIAQFKQQIPTNYLEIKLEEGNHLCTTKLSWKNKPLSERYGFTHGDEWIQIDISHELLEKLGLVQGEDLTGSLFLSPDLLTRKLTYGGITVEEENEIILVNPNKILVKWQGTETDLNRKFLEELEKQLNTLKTEKANLEMDIIKKDEEIKDLKKERDARPNISLVDWVNDWSKRISKEDYDKVVSERCDWQNSYNSINNELTRRPTQQQLVDLQDQINDLNLEKSKLNRWLQTFRQSDFLELKGFSNENDFRDFWDNNINHHMKILYLYINFNFSSSTLYLKPKNCYGEWVENIELEIRNFVNVNYLDLGFPLDKYWNVNNELTWDKPLNVLKEWNSAFSRGFVGNKKGTIMTRANSKPNDNIHSGDCKAFASFKWGDSGINLVEGGGSINYYPTSYAHK